MAILKPMGPSHKLIEQNLKRVYQQNLDDEIPERFKDLLCRLRGVTQDDADSDRDPDTKHREIQ